MKLRKLIAKDFLTYKELDYNFVDKPIIIQGINLTDDNQKSNGSGKSSIQAMIEFSFTGDNSRGVRDKDLVRFGCKSAFLELTTVCDVRKEEVCIKWEIKTKGSNILSITKRKFGENWEEVEFSNVADGKKWILNWLAIDKKDLFNYFIINKTRFKSFFKNSNKEKVELINRFSDASVVDGIEEIDKSELEEKQADLNKSININDGKLQVLKESLLKEENRDFKKELEEKLGSIDLETIDIDEEYEEYEGEISNNNESIKKLNAKVVEKSDLIEVQKLKKQSFKTELENENKNLTPLSKDLEEAQQLVDNFVETDFELKKQPYSESVKEFEENISIKNNDIDKNLKSKTQVLKIIQKLSVKLSGSITCPNCQHEFLLGEGEDLGEIKSKKDSAEGLQCKIDKISNKLEEDLIKLNEGIKLPKLKIKEIETLEGEEKKDYNKLVESVSNFNKIVIAKNNEIEKIKSNISDCNSNISLFESEIISIKKEVSELESHNTSYKASMEALLIEKESLIKSKSSLKEVDNTKDIEELKLNIKNIEKLKLKYEKDLNSVENELFLLNQWSNNFKQFKMHIANKSLEVMEYHCNRYLEGMGTDLRTKFEGFKVLASGNIKDEITAKILRGDEREFGSFSGGERGKILFASILANRHMINMTNPYGGLQFLSIDEVFEGIDSLGLQKLVEEAKKLQECIMIITHVSDENISEDVLKVVKRNGISNIEL